MNSKLKHIGEVWHGSVWMYFHFEEEEVYVGKQCGFRLETIEQQMLIVY